MNIEEINKNGAVSQQKIEAIQTKTDSLFEQYIKLQDELEQLNINNQYKTINWGQKKNNGTIYE